MRALSYLTLLLGPSAAIASQADAVSMPLTTDSITLTVSNTNPGGPIQTFPSTDTESATTTATDDTSSTTLSLSSESTTATALHPSEPTGVSGGTGTGTGASASATSTSSSSDGAAFRDGGSSKVALVVALGAGLLGWVAF